jgi:serine/tyrosine/threonine adenylyltransferase
VTISSPGSAAEGLSRLESLPLVHGYAGLGEEFSTEVFPRELRGAELLHLNRAGCALLDLDPDSVDPQQAVDWFAGGRQMPGARPVAAVYSGHQFGVWAGQLGDGRALLFGEIRNHRGETWDVQVKGSGPTPYSRGGDGRAVWRSTLREYLGGEALAGLGIPTTRALALFTSEEPVYREEVERGALLVRLARCHVRLGTFEHFHWTRRQDLVRVLFGYSLGRWYPHLLGLSARAGAFLDEVTDRTASMVAQWMAVGFCHGVMNTDNFSILGETLDYGPYAFMDDFVWDHICNCSDHEGRYAFSKQPEVGLWNLLRFAEALQSLFPDTAVEALMEHVNARYGEAFEVSYKGLMAGKLGVEVGAAGFDSLLDSTLDLLGRTKTDYTCFWRELSQCDLASTPDRLRARFAQPTDLDAWWPAYRAFRSDHPIGGSVGESGRQMLATNPRYVARNYLLQEIIAEETSAGRCQRIEDLLEVLRDPYGEHPGLEALAEPPRGAQKALSIGCSS